MLKERDSKTLEQTDVQSEQPNPEYKVMANQLLMEQVQTLRRVMEFESIFVQPFVKALGKTDKGIDYAGSCDCDAGCFNCNCNCVIGCT